MRAGSEPMTASELLRMPRGRYRCELIHGVLVTRPLADSGHGAVAARLLASLGQHVQQRALGDVFAAGTGFTLAIGPDHVRAPDVAFIARARLDRVREVDGFWPGAPDLVAEVVSPSDTYAEVEDKIFDWLGADCRMVIVVNARTRAVTVYRSLSQISVLGANDTLHGADVVPGWQLPIAQLFV